MAENIKKLKNAIVKHKEMITTEGSKQRRILHCEDKTNLAEEFRLEPFPFERP